MLVTLGFWLFQWLGAFHIGHFPQSGTLLLQGLDREHKTHPLYGGPMEGALKGIFVVQRHFAKGQGECPLPQHRGASNAPLTRGRSADGRKSRNSHSKADSGSRMQAAWSCDPKPHLNDYGCCM